MSMYRLLVLFVGYLAFAQAYIVPFELHDEIMGCARLRGGDARIAYGRVLGQYEESLDGTDEDVIEAVRVSLEWIHDQTCPVDDQLPRVVRACKLLLRSTRNHDTHEVYEWNDRKGSGAVVRHRRAVVLGKTLYITFAVDSPVHTVYHRVVVSQGRARDWNLFQHVSCVHCEETDGAVGVSLLTTGACRVPPSSYVHPLSSSSSSVPPLFPLPSPRAAAASHSLRVLTYNIWNFNEWPVYDHRLTLLGQILREADADIVAFQEMRYDYARARHGRNQAEHMARLLPGYQFVFQPAMSYTERTFGRVEEGTAIFSRLPIIEHDYVLLSRDHANHHDDHQRTCLRVAVAVPSLGPVHVYVSHFAHVEAAQRRAVLEIDAFIRATHNGAPAIFVGDLNATPDAPAMEFLRGIRDFDGIHSPLRDAWLQLHPEPRDGSPANYDDGDPESADDDAPRDPGLTFATIDRHLRKRIDFVYYDDTLIEARRIATVGDDADANAPVHASDHRGVLVDFVRRTPPTPSPVLLMDG